MIRNNRITVKTSVAQAIYEKRLRLCATHSARNYLFRRVTSKAVRPFVWDKIAIASKVCRARATAAATRVCKFQQSIPLTTE